MMSVISKNVVRDNVSDVMKSLEIISSSDQADKSVYKNWMLVGDYINGVSVTYSNQEDIIEFGLTERVNEEPKNMLHVVVTLITEEDSDCLISVTSDTESEFNYSGKLSEDDLVMLTIALSAFKKQYENNED